MASDTAPAKAFAIPAPTTAQVYRPKRGFSGMSEVAVLGPAELRRAARQHRRLSERRARQVRPAALTGRTDNARISDAVRHVLDASFFELLAEVLEERSAAIVLDLPDHTKLEVWEEAKRRTVPGYKEAGDGP